MSSRVLVIGDVINDVLIRPLGPVTVDSDTRAQIVTRPGGSAANTACWLGATGATVTFVGRAGHRDVEFHTGEFERFFVDARITADREAATGTIAIVVSGSGQRTMFTDRGANLRLSEQDVPGELLDAADLLHVTGYSLFEPEVRSTMLGVLGRAREAGVAFSVDPSSVAFLREVGAESFFEWTAGAALFFPNLDEATFLAGAGDPLVAAERLAQYYGVVAITCGRGGAVVAGRGQEPVRIAAKPVTVVDTTGAGDAFCAGFITEWLKSTDSFAATDAGLAAAAAAVVRMGARPAS